MQAQERDGAFEKILINCLLASITAKDFFVSTALLWSEDPDLLPLQIFLFRDEVFRGSMTFAQLLLAGLFDLVFELVPSEF